MFVIGEIDWHAVFSGILVVSGLLGAGLAAYAKLKGQLADTKTALGMLANGLIDHEGLSDQTKRNLEWIRDKVK